MPDQLTQALGLTTTAMMPTYVLLVNLAVAVVLSLTLSWHYMRYGHTYSNRRELAQVFPLVILATVLIISLIQSNVALSLGLVGALSIVRFRTPIKEPEELAYLFMAIAVGIGLGASQRLTTLVATAVILGVATARGRVVEPDGMRNLYLNVEVPHQAGEQSVLHTIDRFLNLNTRSSQVRRLDVSDGRLQATYCVDCRDGEGLVALMEDMSKLLPTADISFVEQRGLPGL